jgi:hypothetical protein
MSWLSSAKELIDATVEGAKRQNAVLERQEAVLKSQEAAAAEEARLKKFQADSAETTAAKDEAKKRSRRRNRTVAWIFSAAATGMLAAFLSYDYYENSHRPRIREKMRAKMTKGPTETMLPQCPPGSAVTTPPIILDPSEKRPLLLLG